MCFEKFNSPGPHGTLQVDGRRPKCPSQGVGAPMFHSILYPQPQQGRQQPSLVSPMSVFPNFVPARELISTASQGPSHSLAQSPSGPSKGHPRKV